MAAVEVRSYLRVSDGEFVEFDKVRSYTGDCRYVSGAISLVIDGIELFGTELWDDVNWLWPLLVQALDDCRQTGSGTRGFPDKPVSITADRDRARPGHTVLRVADGAKTRRGAVVPDGDLYATVALAGIAFDEQLARFCPPLDGEQRRTLERWLANEG